MSDDSDVLSLDRLRGTDGLKVGDQVEFCGVFLLPNSG